MKTIPELRESATLRVVIVYRDTELLPRAYRWCDEQKWEVVAVVPTHRYADALLLVNSGPADIIVAASKDSLDPNRVPRIEVVPDEEDDEEPTDG